MIYLIIGLIVFGVFLYSYQSNPNTIYEKAKSLIAKNRFEEALIKLKSIQVKHAEAITLCAVCNLTESKLLITSDPNRSLVLLTEGLQLSALINNSISNKESFRKVQRDIVDEMVALSMSFSKTHKYDLAIKAILYVKNLEPSALDKYAEYKYNFALSIKDLNNVRSISLFEDVLSAKKIFVSSAVSTQYLLYVSKSSSELYNVAKNYLLQNNHELFEPANEILKLIASLHPESITTLAKSKYLEADYLLSKNLNVESKRKLDEALYLKESLLPVSNRDSFTQIEKKVYDKQYDLSLIFIQLKEFENANGILVSLINTNPFAVATLAESYLLKGRELVTENLDKAYGHYKEGLECRKLLNDISNIDYFVEVEKSLNNALFELADRYIKEKKYATGNLILTSLYKIHNEASQRHIESLYFESLDYIKTKPKESISLLDSAVLLGGLLTVSLEKNKYTPIEKKIIEAYIFSSESLVSSGDFHIALSTISKLFDKHPEALSKFITYKSHMAKGLISKNADQSATILDEAIAATSFSKSITNTASLQLALEDIYNTYILLAEFYISNKFINKAFPILQKIETLHKSALPMIIECHFLEGMNLLSTPEKAEKCMQIAFSKMSDAPSNTDKSKLNQIGKKINSALLLIAKEYTKKAKYLNSYTILSSLFKLESEAVTQYAESKYQEACSYSDKDLNRTIDLLMEAIQCNELLTKESNKHYFALVVEKAKLKIAEIRFDEYSNNDLKSEELKEQIERVLKNLKFVQDIQIIRLGLEIKELISFHHESLQNLYLDIAYRFESENKLVEAKTNYTKALAFSDYKVDLYYCAFIRNQICTLKKGSKVTKAIVSEICNIEHSFKEDFIYRYVITLLKENKVEEADKYIDSYLNIKNKAVQKLKSLCHKQKIEIAQIELAKFNELIIAITDNTLSLTETKEIYNSLETKAVMFSTYFPHVKQPILELKPLIFNNLLSLLFAEYYFIEVIKLIKEKFPRFYEDYGLLRNVGIACMGIAENELITEKNYKEVVSLWLTCIHCDYLILSTLEFTSWDDDYTFTLKGSIGTNYEQNIDLPDNVNNDEPDNSNISIGDVQRELVKKFELQIDKIVNPILQKKVSEFYETEKKAIQMCVEIIMSDILFCTPYFAETYNLNTIITNELTADYEQYGTEAALKAGQFYDIRKQNNLISEYSEASQDCETIFIAVGKLDAVQLKNSLTSSKVQGILKYDGICPDFEDKIYISISKQISDDSLNEKIIPILEHIIKICPNYINIKLLYARFINSLCVEKVNSKKMTNEQALSLTNKAYSLSPDDNQLKNNLYIIIGMVMHDIVNKNNINGQIALNNALNKLKNDSSFVSEMNDFIQRMDFKSPRIIPMIDQLIAMHSSNLLQEKKADVLQTQIVVRVNSGTISNSQALKEMRDIYVLFPKHNQICENLCGIILACLLETIDASGSSYSTFGTIDSIISNKSITFRSKAAVLSKQRIDILLSLPATQRPLFLGVYSPTESLNEHGLKIKKVLDYLNDLSN